MRGLPIPINDYHFITRWRVRGAIETVARYWATLQTWCAGGRPSIWTYRK